VAEGIPMSAAYSYDGTYGGLLCCLSETYEKKEMPAEVLSPEDTQTTLYPVREIATDPEKAARADAAIAEKISPAARELARLGLLTCLAQKELWILRFLRLGFHYGGDAVFMLANRTVLTLNKAVQNLKNESHQYEGFVRFSVFGGALTSVIEPKNRVLPLLAPHFCDRYANEAFLIYDRTHGMALVYQAGRREIIPLDDLILPEPDEKELEYRRLWRTMYRTIAIRERNNPKCRRTHMPKRYWKYLTEFQSDDFPRRRSGENSPVRKTEGNALQLPLGRGKIKEY
jgi:probable DNA metabolism protein